MVASNGVRGRIRLTIVDTISPAFSVQAKVDLREVASWRPKFRTGFLKAGIAYDKIIFLFKFVKKLSVSIREFAFKSRVEVAKDQ